MNPRLIPSIVALALLAIAPAAVAQVQPGKNGTARFGDPTSNARIYQDYLFGVIKNVDKNELVLEKTKFGVDQTIKLDSKTKFIHDGKPSSLDNLKVGQDVYVQTKKEKKTGDMVAKKVVTGVAATLAE